MYDILARGTLASIKKASHAEKRDILMFQEGVPWAKLGAVGWVALQKQDSTTRCFIVGDIEMTMTTIMMRIMIVMKIMIVMRMMIISNNDHATKTTTTATV